MTATGQPQRLAILPSFRWCLGFAGLSLIYNALFLRTFSHWWYEDDPYLFAFVYKVANPIRFFLSPATIHAYGAGGALSPFQALSEWIDGVFAYRSLAFAHLHNTISVAVTLALLFQVLRRFALTTGAALLLCLLWLCLPSTIVVTNFLAARHYLEGFTVSLLAIAWAQKLALREWEANAPRICLLCLTTACAMLFKEVFAITLPLFLALYLHTAQRRRTALCTFILIAPYLAYRYWIFGGGVSWGSPFLGPAEYIRYLSRLPYTFTGNVGGYIVLALLLVGLFFVSRNGKLHLGTCFSIFALLISQLAVIYPVSFPLNLEWTDRGTWYRAVFLLSTGLLLGGGYLMARLPHRRLSRYSAVTAVLVLLSGAVATRSVWQRSMLQFKREGRFYLSHPERLLYSEVPGGNFLDGVRQLYDIPVRHHIPVAERLSPPQEELSRYQTIWRLQGDKFVEDRTLFTELSANARRQPSAPSPK